MKQLLQNSKNGDLQIEEIPVPMLKSGNVIVQNAFSLVSTGTERSTVETTKANIFQKAKKRPDLVRQVIDNVKREGIIETYQKVQSRLTGFKPLGYSSAGIVVESACQNFRIGERVACGGNAHHAEYILIPKNLCAKVPHNVNLKHASFTTLGAIATQGVRQSEATIGDRIVVIGLGLIGLLTTSVLKAAGCQVLGVDISELNFEVAQKIGCDQVCLIQNLSKECGRFTNEVGADSILITASTQSNQPIEIAGEIARQKGIIVIVGVTGLNIPRDPYYYQKELDLRFSCSYGPGRYDPNYEEKGQDYPIGYVRWTENQNMVTFLSQLALQRIDLEELITHVFSIDQASSAYDVVLGKRKEHSIGILINYNHEDTNKTQRLESRPCSDKGKTKSSWKVGVIGAGNFAQSYILPHIAKMHNVSLHSVCTATGISAKSVAEKFDFMHFTTNPKDVFENPDIGIVLVATRHNSHSEYVLEGLKASKHVYVEKPLCLKRTDLQNIIKMKNQVDNRHQLMVGYNRRFAPMIQKVRNHMANIQEPIAINYRINAGYIPQDHWIHDKGDGGGRILGEVCHFVDMVQFLSASLIRSVFAVAIPNLGKYSNDNVSIILETENGSIGTISYLANGSLSMTKERIEVSVGGNSAMIDDFQVLELFLGRKSKRHKEKQDKGHQAEINSFFNAVKSNQEPPIPFEEIVNSSLATFSILESLSTGKKVEIQ